MSEFRPPSFTLEEARRIRAARDFMTSLEGDWRLPGFTPPPERKPEVVPVTPVITAAETNEFLQSLPPYEEKTND